MRELERFDNITVNKKVATQDLIRNIDCHFFDRRICKEDNFTKTASGKKLAIVSFGRIMQIEEVIKEIKTSPNYIRHAGIKQLLTLVSKFPDKKWMHVFAAGSLWHAYEGDFFPSIAYIVDLADGRYINMRFADEWFGESAKFLVVGKNSK